MSTAEVPHQQQCDKWLTLSTYSNADGEDLDQAGVRLHAADTQLRASMKTISSHSARK